MSSTKPPTKFEVSAPGKLILHGEHSVIYGHPAVAGPISQRTYLTYTALDRRSAAPNATAGASSVVVFEFQSIPFTSSLTLEAFNKFLAEIDCQGALQPEQFLAQMQSSGSDGFPFARFVQQQPTLLELAPKERYSLGSALYIFNRVLRAEGISSIDPVSEAIGPDGFQLSVRSMMSIGAGLGSSASFGVCLAAGAYALSRLLKGLPVTLGDDDDGGEETREAVLAKVCRWAFDLEVIMHTKPSGIDNTIATYGKLVRFCRGDSNHATVALRHPLHTLIVDTGVSRSTAKLVAINAQRRALYPRTINPILDAMGGLVEEAIELYEKEDEQADNQGGGDTTVHERLSTLVTINNNLLRSLGASHPSLERIFALAEQHGFASKLTGAGGGGCAFVLLPANYERSDSYHKLVDALDKDGYNCMATCITEGKGVCLQTIRD